MTQVLFQEQDVTAVDQEIGGIGVAAEVGVQPRHPGHNADSTEQGFYSIIGHGVTVNSEEKLFYTGDHVDLDEVTFYSGDRIDMEYGGTMPLQFDGEVRWLDGTHFPLSITRQKPKIRLLAKT